MRPYVWVIERFHETCVWVPEVAQPLSAARPAESRNETRDFPLLPLAYSRLVWLAGKPVSTFHPLMLEILERSLHAVSELLPLESPTHPEPSESSALID